MMSERHEPQVQGAWSGHEHLTTTLENQAQKLLDEAGSPELAKHAVDSVAQSHDAAGNAQGLAASSHDQFARQLGFASYLSLFEASTPLTSAIGKQWFITALRSDLWVVWNDADLVAAGSYPTRDAAERGLPPSTSERST